MNQLLKKNTNTASPSSPPPPSTIYSANFMSLYFNNSCIKPIWWSDGMNKRTVHYGRVNFTWDLLICNTLLPKTPYIFFRWPSSLLDPFPLIAIKKSFGFHSVHSFHSFTCSHVTQMFVRPFHISLALTLIVVFHFRSTTISEQRVCVCVCTMLGQYIYVYSII